MLDILNLDSENLADSSFPSDPFAIVTRAISLLKGLDFAGWFGAAEVSNTALDKESKRVAYEMRRTLGIKGFVLNLTSSAALGTGLPACWDAVRPCLETPELEDAACHILSEASSLAEALGKTNHKSSLRLSQNEATHLQEGLDFYHFVLPKMLVLTSALRLACQQELLKRGVTKGNATQKNAVGQDGLQNLFQNIRQILSIPTAAGSLQMPEAWAKYLLAASAELKPLVQGENFNRASNQLHNRSCQLAPSFQDRVSAMEMESLQAIAHQVSKLETLLPSLIMSLNSLELYFRPTDLLAPAHAAPASSLLPAATESATEGNVARESATRTPCSA